MNEEREEQYKDPYEDEIVVYNGIRCGLNLMGFKAGQGVYE